MSDGQHLYPTVTATPTDSRVGSFDGRRSLLDAADSEISSIDTFPTVPVSELGNVSILEDDAVSMRSTSSSSSHGVAYITEYPTHDLATTSAVLYYCKKKFLRPYLRLLAVLGWRPFSESTTFRFAGVLNKVYFLLFLGLLVVGCALQYCACYRLDGELPSQHFFFQSRILRKANASSPTNATGRFAHEPLGGLFRRQRNPHDDFPPDPNEENCQNPSLAAFILPDILLIAAYLYFFYLMRIAENEQMETLMERAVKGRIWLALGILWFLASAGAQLLYLASAEVRFRTISYSLLPSVHNTLEAFLIIGTWLQDVVQITLITSFCLQVQLLRLALWALINQVLQRQISLENAMKDIGESEKYLDYLNRELGISIALLLLVNMSRFASGSVWFMISDISMIPGVVLAASIIMVILWGILFLMPLVQACRLTATYNAIRNLGHKVRERPFGFQTVSPGELDSFLLYTSSLNHRAKIVCLPLTAGFVCFVVGFFVVIALTMLQVISALPTY